METKGQDKNEIVITRVFDAPRHLVWKAWTEPEHLMRWWGPKDYTSPACAMDLRVGGQYLYLMRSPDGRDYWSTGVYREIVPLKRIVSTDSFSDADGNVVPAIFYGMSGDFPLEMLLTVVLEDEGDKTRITLRHAGVPEGPMIERTWAGWNESLDKLEESLITVVEKLAPGMTEIVALEGKPELVATRVFDAPRRLVFKMFTDPKRVPQWWGPKILTTTVEEMDVRPGGAWRFVQRDARGNEYVFSGVYREIVPPERIVQTFEFEAMAGHGSIETVTFEERGGLTRVTEKALFHSVEDRDGMLASGAEEGWAESHDRLEELLKKERSERQGSPKPGLKKAIGPKRRRGRTH